MPQSLYAERSSFFGPLSHLAQSYNKNEAENILPKARMSFINKVVFKPAQ